MVERAPTTSERGLATRLLGTMLCVGLIGAASFTAVTHAADPSPREAAPMDLTGDWVAVITEDWRWRMIVPPKGDYASVPLTAAGMQLADQWDPDRDRANGDACKAYGAAGIMRLPVRLKIQWLDDERLQIAIDAGEQTRVLHFSAKPDTSMAPSLQGYSVAEWRGDVIMRTGRTRETEPRHLQVVTQSLAPGYLRRNGVPYGANAGMTEYFHTQSAYGEQWFTVTTVVEDPDYLTQPFVTSSSFRKVSARATTWNPGPCVSEWGPVQAVQR